MNCDWADLVAGTKPRKQPRQMKKLPPVLYQPWKQIIQNSPGRVTRSRLAMLQEKALVPSPQWQPHSPSKRLQPTKVLQGSWHGGT
ncbi:hypothetical protein PVAP13_1NG044620 [Panicum virgatum]|uniref:Uncharacterized protein n=1 Tax=Panicum virgatum TaxID=38727 RepID=A0A8T0WRD0_PANVG|nr:hypothetical protein PVAP13_1NG044620 [Panicum virgatum]